MLLEADMVKHIQMCVSVAGQYEQLATEYHRLALNLIETERLKKSPEDWAVFLGSLGMDEDDIAALRNGVGMDSLTDAPGGV